jgi:hypothetical protein
MQQFFTSISFVSISRVGMFLWTALLAFWRPDLHHDLWARSILLMAALVWVPMVLHLLDYPKSAAGYVGLAGAALVAAFHCDAGWVAALLSLPWLVVTLWIFARGVDFWAKNAQNAGDRAIAASQVFLVVGALWTLADRLGWRPLGFDPAIVLLTGVHFHYAGFLFTWLVGRSAQQWPNALSNMAAHGAIVSVPLTAAGITATQLWGHHALEALSAACVAFSGWLTAGSYFGAVYRGGLPAATRFLWVICALCLVFSMSLALGYAVRPWWHIEWLAIPNMRAWHGTANALGVAGCGVLGWLVFKAGATIPFRIFSKKPSAR